MGLEYNRSKPYIIIGCGEPKITFYKYNTREGIEMAKTFYKDEFAKMVGVKIEDGTKKQSLEYIKAIKNTIAEILSNGDKVHLKNFGTFEPFLREERICRNPRNDEKITIPEIIIPKFKASDNFKEKTNK